jgi:hypothetical protein
MASGRQGLRPSHFLSACFGWPPFDFRDENQGGWLTLFPNQNKRKPGKKKPRLALFTFQTALRFSLGGKLVPLV